MQGRFTIAAKHHMTIAEIYETDMVDVEKVIYVIKWYLFSGFTILAVTVVDHLIFLNQIRYFLAIIFFTNSCSKIILCCKFVALKLHWQ